MNYWHTQLHPDDRDTFNETRIRELLEQRAVIGLGQWDDGEAIRSQFFDEMRVGDIVAVKNGSTPIALVRVASEAYVAKNVNEELDWFPNRRNIEVLDYYQNAYNFSFPDSRGTLKICRDLNAPTSRLIMNWYQTAQRKNIMNNSRLSDKRKQELKLLWKDFENSIGNKDINWEASTTGSNKTIDNVVQEQIDNWGIYREKIINQDLQLQEYTNRKEGEETIPGYYLCNFLERTTRHAFGSSRPGNSTYFEIKLNEDRETYTIRESLGRNEKENFNDQQAALEYYNREISPLLYNIVNSRDINNKILQVEQSTYAAKQVLRKMVVLDDPYQFINIYSDDVVNQLHKEFIDSDTVLNLQKNNEIRLFINEVLNIENSNRNNFLVSRFLWQYAGSKGIADEDSPNVILYGPPGTGKTYSVKKSLKFICKGDNSRFEILQFHPSFTYEDFIDGIKPKGVSKEGNLKFEMVNGAFKKFCIRAKQECINAHREQREPKAYYFIVDEINRANLSSVFGETLSLLEKGYRHNGIDTENLMKTQNTGLIEELIKDNPDNTSLAYHTEGGQVYFGVPKNVFFIGMMNDVDKSIDTFDLALRRRFKWIRKDCDYDVVENDVKFRNGDDFNNIEEYRKCCEKLNTFISQELGLGKSYEFGHSFFMKISDISSTRTISVKNLEKLFELHLKPTFKEYLRAMYPESELDKKIAEGLQKFTSKIQA